MAARISRIHNDSSHMRDIMSWNPAAAVSASPHRSNLSHAPARDTLNLFQSPRSAKRSAPDGKRTSGKKKWTHKPSSIFTAEVVPDMPKTRCSRRCYANDQEKKHLFKDHFDECVSLRKSAHVTKSAFHPPVRLRSVVSPLADSFPLRVNEREEATPPVSVARDLSSHWQHNVVWEGKRDSKAPGRRWEGKGARAVFSGVKATALSKSSSGFKDAERMTDSDSTTGLKDAAQPTLRSQNELVPFALGPFQPRRISRLSLPSANSFFGMTPSVQEHARSTFRTDMLSHPHLTPGMFYQRLLRQ